MLVVAAYGLILPSAVLGLPRLGCINVHASLLPRWRGAAPIQRAILAGDRDSGITIMQMDAGLDTGAILAQQPVPIGATMSAQQLHDELAALGARLLLATLDALETGRVRAQAQSDADACYAAKIDKREAVIDWQLEVEQIDRQVRAFNPRPVAETRWRGEQLRIWEAYPASVPLQAAVGAASPPGTLLGVEREALLVGCGRGVLALRKVQLASRRPVLGREFAAGQPATAVPGCPGATWDSSSRSSRPSPRHERASRAGAARAERCGARHCRHCQRRALGGQRARALCRGGPAGAAVRAVTLGAIRWYLQLEPLVAALLTHARLAPVLRSLLVATLFQLEHSRHPHEALVSSAVEAARLLHQPRAAGLINAVLRRYLRERETLRARLLRGEAVVTAHPSWLIEALRRAWPQHWRAMLEANNTPAPMTLRVDLTRVALERYRAALAEQGLAATPIPWLPTALVLEHPVAVGALPGFEEGWVSVQDAAAQLSSQLLAPRAGERVLDACAAPGGKTAALLEAANGAIELTAVDSRRHPARARIGDTASPPAPRPGWCGPTCVPSSSGGMGGPSTASCSMRPARAAA